MNTIIDRIFKEKNFKAINLYNYNKIKLKDYNLKKINNAKLSGENLILSGKYRIKRYINEVDLYIPNDLNGKKEYFVVINLRMAKLENLDSLILEDFNNIFADIRNNENYSPYMEKNTSLIILLELEKDQIEKNTLNKKIFEIEENQYNFKKYVLTYDNNQVQHLKSELTQEKTVTSTINDIVYNTSEFTNFKLNPNESSKYNLVTKLYIKLPFLNLNKKGKEIEVLKDTIDKELNMLGYSNLVEKIIEVKDISNLSDDEIFSIVEGTE